jgi:hypothetical protein|tara:strand:- start:4 stop:954 length:951 start_codon:yes stop_codon:yes gene_type:complete
MHIKNERGTQMSIKKGKGGRRLHRAVASSLLNKPNVITMLGHKHDRATLAPYGKVKDGQVFYVRKEHFDRFKFLPTNRKTYDNQVHRLMGLLKEPRGQRDPVKINKRWEVIDGQHRIQAAIKGQIDAIMVLMQENATIDDVIVMNTSQKKWCWQDYLKTHSHESRPSHGEYKKLSKFMEDYGLNYKVAIWLLSGNNHDYGVEDFEEGSFEVKEEDKAIKQATYLKTIKGYKKVDVSVFKFTKAFIALQKLHSKDGKKMLIGTLMSKLKKYGGKYFSAGGNQEYYYDEMCNCYNERTPKMKQISWTQKLIPTDDEQD